jgi:hypothetical protein
VPRERDVVRSDDQGRFQIAQEVPGEDDVQGRCASADTGNDRTRRVREQLSDHDGEQADGDENGEAEQVVRGTGVNYDTGFTPGGHDSRPVFDADIVAAEMAVIARELRCPAVRITGGRPERLSVAAEAASAEGLEVWFSPFPCEQDAAGLLEVFADCADRAEHLRRAGGRVVLVTGCEVTLFNRGFLPGRDSYDRIRRLSQRRPGMVASVARLPRRLRAFLAEAADVTRRRFGGPLTYAAGTWEPVDWSAFDIVSVDAYRDAGNAARFQTDLGQRRVEGKPLAVTEFGCCAYAGAGARGGMGWTIADYEGDIPRLTGDYERDEQEQVSYLRELRQVFAAEDVDLAFWFTFAGYSHPTSPDPQLDVDMASYGLVTMLPEGPGSGYRGLGWRPRLVFAAMAEAGPSNPRRSGPSSPPPRPTA